MSDLRTLWNSRWARILVLFLAGLGLFLLARTAAGEEGVRAGKIFFIGIFALVLLGAVLYVIARFRSIRADKTGRMVRLLRAGRVDEAVRVGREQFEATPSDPRLLWNYTAALIKSGHLAEARRIFAQIQPESLPPKMAAMYPEVRDTLNTTDPAGRP